MAVLGGSTKRIRTLNITAGRTLLYGSAGATPLLPSPETEGPTGVRTNRRCSLFLVLRFRGSFGYAVGTTGFIALTSDGGLTWQHTATPYVDVLSASFSDSRHGLLRTRSGVLQTTDGTTWTSVSERYAIDFNKFPYVLGVAALDQKHMAIHISEPPPSGSGFLFTKDGGISWSFDQIPNSTITSMVIQGDQSGPSEQKWSTRINLVADTRYR